MRYVLASALLFHALAGAAATPSWIERSNENARFLLATQAPFDPEGMGAFGVEGLDEKVLTLPLDHSAQETRAWNTAIAELERRLAAERDPAVRQDLEILIDGGKRRVEDLRLQETGGIAGLFRKYGLTGWEEPYARLKEQLAAYDALLRAAALREEDR